MASMTRDEQRTDVPPAIYRSTINPIQKWTTDGYPIVDGKYHDLAADEIKEHTGVFSAGPPTLSVYWNNCGPVRNSDPFLAMGCFSKYTVTEYLARVGEMLRQGRCTVSSLNATQYSVNVIVTTELSSRDFKEMLREYGLTASSNSSDSG